MKLEESLKRKRCQKRTKERIKERRYKNFSRFTEKKINKDLINSELTKKQKNNNPSYTSASKLNQTSF